MKLHKKAYCISNTYDYYEPWYIADETIHASTRGKAKAEAIVRIDGAERRDREDTTFLNIRLRRQPEYDLFINDEGKVGSRKKFLEETEEAKRVQELKQMLIDNPDGFAYIKKRGLYYRPNCNGYTEERLAAGIYTLKDAVSQGLSCESLQIIQIDKEGHNKYFKNHIEDFTSKLL